MNEFHYSEFYQCVNARKSLTNRNIADSDLAISIGCMWLERKKKVQIKGMISMRMLILSYTIQQVILNVCTKFKILGRVIPEKSLTEKSLHTDKHCYGKDKNYIPLIHFICQWYNKAQGFMLSLWVTHQNLHVDKIHKNKSHFTYNSNYVIFMLKIWVKLLILEICMKQIILIYLLSEVIQV